jgi:hypothetical protein
MSKIMPPKIAKFRGVADRAPPVFKPSTRAVALGVRQGARGCSYAVAVIPLGFTII